MKKWLFNATVAGYYLCSIVLGVAMALTVGLAACDVWDYKNDQYWLAEKTAMREYPGGGFTEDTTVDMKTHSINYDAGVYYPKGDGATEAAWVKLSRRYDKLSQSSHYRPLSDL